MHILHKEYVVSMPTHSYITHRHTYMYVNIYTCIWHIYNLSYWHFLVVQICCSVQRKKCIFKHINYFEQNFNYKMLINSDLSISNCPIWLYLNILSCIICHLLLSLIFLFSCYCIFSKFSILSVLIYSIYPFLWFVTIFL